MWIEYKGKMIGTRQNRWGYWIVAIEWYTGNKLDGFQFETKEEAFEKGKQVIDSL